jgi:hypothetical protein
MRRDATAGAPLPSADLSPPVADVLLARLAALEQAVARASLARAAQLSQPDRALASEPEPALATLEAELLDLAVDINQLEPDAELSPLRLAMAALRDWRQLIRSLDETAAEQNCRHRIEQLLAREAAVWRAVCLRRIGALDSNGCFDSLVHTTGLWSEAIVYGKELAETRRHLAEVHAACRQVLAKRMAAGDVGELQRQRFATEWIDRSELALTSIESLPAAMAAQQLERLADDLDWHLEHIERARGSWRRRLKRKRRRLRTEAQERLLQSRLEARFGAANVARFDRLILGLIVLVIGLIVAETAIPLSPAALFWLHLTDAVACGLFLWDFGVRLYHAPHRGSWFARHALIDLLPSIPYGLLLGGLHHGRLVDVPQLLRSLRLLRLQPVIRLFRAFGFLARGMDRLARRLAPLLNRSVILYPTRGERQRARGGDERIGPRLRQLHVELGQRWRHAALAAESSARAAIVAARIDSLADHALRQSAVVAELPGLPAGALPREVPAELVLRRLGSLTPAEALAELGPDLLERLARVVRLFARPPLAWFPIIRGIVPRIGNWMSDGDVMAAAARRLAAALKQYHDRWFWLADLHGTVTPSVFVDRLGTMLVKSSFRPAYRLALFGGVYLLVKALLRITPLWFLLDFERFLSRFVGSALSLLAGVCCVVFGIGWWLKRLAREATEFYERAAEAQFLSLTEIVRSRTLDRDARIFYHRVLRPEWQMQPDGAAQSVAAQIDCFRQRVRLSLLADGCDDQQPAFDMLQRTVLLYRDSLDGAILADNDNRTTCQLLGNPAIRQFLMLSERMGRRQMRRLRFLDLERQKSLLGGPYLWFNFISRAAAHNAACLIIDYNRHAVPAAEVPLLDEAKRRRFESWLDGNNGDGDGLEQAADNASQYVTTAFTALHFLDCDPQRDREIGERFGAAVLKRLYRDRALLVRRLFGTYPWHLRPKEFRILNLYALYERWLSGGRALLLPLVVLAGFLRHVARIAGWIWRAVQEIRHPELRVDRTADIEADFATAVRKIERMRGPVVEASLRLRGTLDPEYLGVPLPGQTASALAGADVRADLEFLDAQPWMVEAVDRQQARAAADMRRLARLIDGGLLARIARHLELPAEAVSTPAHLRAAAVAYLADYRGVRRLLSWREILDEVFQRAPLEPPHTPTAASHMALGRLFRAYWKLHGRSTENRAACWWAARQIFWGVADALAVWRRHGDAAREQGERLLAELLRHPGRITEQLVTMRAVQTLAILDVLNYRQHVYELGRYRDGGDPQEELLQWNTYGVETRSGIAAKDGETERQRDGEI